MTAIACQLGGVCTNYKGLISPISPFVSCFGPAENVTSPVGTGSSAHRPGLLIGLPRLFVKVPMKAPVLGS